jgi:hypothetical protein
LGLAAIQAEEWPTAEAALARGVALCRSIGDRTGEALALNDLGGLALAQGRLTDSRAYLAQSMEMALKDQNHLLRSRVLKNLACLYFQEGQYVEAEADLIRGLRGAETAQSTQLMLELLLELATLWQATALPTTPRRPAAEIYALVALHPAAVAAVRRRALAQLQLGSNGAVAGDPDGRLKELMARVLQGRPIAA